ncbi:hypothetical protein MIMGU_mgv1a021269mg [Erythranthe guttata]|uniref:C2H2-type domain-containing protein n=1 Tax=Erythranthe guttata TaxID=4155 RepID=A0A022QTF4_ERYGU|nr:PREDICTED: zinc finger protein ZAT1-like [Erythranthe guttata]EYU31947.1 hypothetical protein MIMGU_mgv1a021269mg [Erythranthe guttata]|eukprot:XP_012843926.1 PREDICTED: zinc finger protein ZAT1-like [Erythranthe guttata]
MEKRHRCKLCLRSFGNGRALGGHMRSHMMKFYASNKREQVKHAFDSVDFDVVHDSYSSSSDDDDEEEESALLVDHGFGSESDPICRRSNRVRKSRVSDLEDGFFHVDKKLKFGGYCSPEAELSSVSDTTSEEHLAHCLIMLSRDTWQKEEEEEYSGAAVKAKVGRGKYRCEECNKLFRSYQALGGHRASHKKIKLNTPPPPPPSPPRKVSGSPPEKKVHECPFCDRVFSSGQALGGHKRTHFIGGATPAAAAAAASKQSPVIREKLKIDLNLPAPVDEEEDDVSQIAVSAVSDEEFVRPIMR